MEYGKKTCCTNAFINGHLRSVHTAKFISAVVVGSKLSKVSFKNECEHRKVTFKSSFQK